MRQNIKLVYNNSIVDEPSNRNIEEKNVIYFYSHWGGEVGMSPLKMKLKAALRKKLRWDDESYLSRMIFCEMVKGDIDGETGYGISTFEIDPEYPTIVVDFNKQTVDGMPFSKFIQQ